jgi:hypothetical protein
MIGAVIFVIFFLVSLAITLGLPTLPPGGLIHEILNIPQVSYQVLGIPAWQLINASTNGVVYGFVIWLVYSIAASVRGRRKQGQTIQQTVSIERQYSHLQPTTQNIPPPPSTQYVPPPIRPPPHHTPPSQHTAIQPAPPPPITVGDPSEQPALQRASPQPSTMAQQQPAPSMAPPPKAVLQQEFTISSENLINKVKDLLHEGNVIRVIVKDNNGKILLDLPASVSVAGTIATPWLAGLGAIAALATKCTVSVVRRDQHTS